MFKMIKQFTIAYIFSTVVLVILGILMFLLGIDFGSGVGFVATGLSGAYVGYRYAKQYKEIPPKALSWKISFYTIPVMFIVSIPFVLIVIFTDPAAFDPFSEASRIMILSIIVAILLLASLVHVLFVRFSIRIYARFALKAIKRSSS